MTTVRKKESAKQNLKEQKVRSRKSTEQPQFGKKQRTKATPVPKQSAGRSMERAIVEKVNNKDIYCRLRRAQGNGIAELKVEKWKKALKDMVLDSRSRGRENDLAQTSDWPRDWERNCESAQLANNSIENSATNLKPMILETNLGSHELQAREYN